jgi:hypothetical protein
MTSSPPPSGDDRNPPSVQGKGPSFQGKRVVVALLIGMVIGWAVGLFMESIVQHSPTSIDPGDLVWLRRLLAAAGALSGLAIEAMRQLQAANPDPIYHQNRQGLRRRC